MPFGGLLTAGIGAAGAIGGGLIGNASASGDRQAAIDAYKQSVADYEAIGVPSIEAQQIVLQKYQSEGKLTPELQEAIKQEDTGLQDITTDPQYKAAQLQALQKLQDLGSNGGLSLTDKANLEQTMGDVAAQERGSREAILQDAQQRGGYGSGAALAAQLMNQQGAASRNHQAGLAAAGSAQDRALQAIIQAGTLGTSLRNQDYDQAAAAAKAQDTINQWNAANSQDVQAANAAAKNSAAAANLANAQNISNANVDTTNKQETYNKGLAQTNFNNQLAVTQGKANARSGQASNLNANAQNTADMWSGIGSGVAQGAGAIAQYANSGTDTQPVKKKPYSSAGTGFDSSTYA